MPIMEVNTSLLSWTQETVQGIFITPTYHLFIQIIPWPKPAMIASNTRDKQN